MRHVSQALQDLLEPTVNALGFELLGVLYLKSQSENTVRLYIDHDSGIGVDDCAAVSHQVSGVLEVEATLKEAFTLEVSSPGTDRPLFKLAHFTKFIGYDAKLWLLEKINGRVKLFGKIIKVDCDAVTVTDSDIEYCVPFGVIDRAKLVPVL